MHFFVHWLNSKVESSPAEWARVFNSFPFWKRLSKRILKSFSLSPGGRWDDWVDGRGVSDKGVEIFLLRLRSRSSCHSDLKLLTKEMGTRESASFSSKTEFLIHEQWTSNSIEEEEMGGRDWDCACVKRSSTRTPSSKGCKMESPYVAVKKDLKSKHTESVRYFPELSNRKETRNGVSFHSKLIQSIPLISKSWKNWRRYGMWDSNDCITFPRTTPF